MCREQKEVLEHFMLFYPEYSHHRRNSVQLQLPYIENYSEMIRR